MQPLMPRNPSQVQFPVVKAPRPRARYDVQVRTAVLLHSCTAAGWRQVSLSLALTQEHDFSLISPFQPLFHSYTRMESTPSHRCTAPSGFPRHIRVCLPGGGGGAGRAASSTYTRVASSVSVQAHLRLYGPRSCFHSPSHLLGLLPVSPVLLPSTPPPPCALDTSVRDRRRLRCTLT